MMVVGENAEVISVSLSRDHSFGKRPTDSIDLIEGIGVAGDAHSGVTVQHLSRIRRNPSTPNLRQVHLLHAELFDDLRAHGHVVRPGELGENITTRGIDLLGLPVGARLVIADAVIAVTGLRNPCRQIDSFQAGLLGQVLRKGPDGEVERLAGVMGTVARGGRIRTGDSIIVELPPEPRRPLTPV